MYHDHVLSPMNHGQLLNYLPFNSPCVDINITIYYPHE